MLNPFAVDHKGRTVHVDGPDALVAPFTCPGCSESLVFVSESAPGKRSQRRHFRHEVDTECSGGPETALHHWSKRIVAEACTIQLPRHVVEYKGLQEIYDDEWTYHKSEVESWRDGIQPDVILHKARGELAVEIRVWHEVDAHKREKLQSRRTSCIEVDMRPWLGQLLNEDELRQAVLHQAGRIWISHENENERQKALRDNWESKAGDRAEALRRLLTKPKRIGRDHATLEFRIELHGLEPFVGIDVAGDHWFEEPSRHWQTRVLTKMLRQTAAPGYDPDRPDPHYHNSHAFDPRQYGIELRHLPAYHDEMVQGSGIALEEYASPASTVKDYLRHVAAMADHQETWPARILDPLPDAVIVNSEWGRAASPLNSLVTTYLSINERDEDPDILSRMSAWLRTPVASGGRTPMDICRSGGVDVARLLAQASWIYIMARDGGPPVRHLMGLAPESMNRTAEAWWRHEGPKERGSWSYGHPDLARALRMLDAGESPLSTLVRMAQRRTTARAANVFVTTPHNYLGGATPSAFVKDTATLMYVIPLLDALDSKRRNAGTIPW